MLTNNTKLILDESLFFERVDLSNDAASDVSDYTVVFDKASMRRRYIEERLPRITSTVGGIYYNHMMSKSTNPYKENSDSFEVRPYIKVKGINTCVWAHYFIDGRAQHSRDRVADIEWLNHNEWARKYYKLNDIIFKANKQQGLQMAINLMDYLGFKETDFTPDENCTEEDIVKNPYIYNITDYNTMHIYCAVGSVDITGTEVQALKLSSPPDGIKLLKKKRAPNKPHDKEISDNTQE